MNRVEGDVFDFDKGGADSPLSGSLPTLDHTFTDSPCTFPRPPFQTEELGELIPPGRQLPSATLWTPGTPATASPPLSTSEPAREQPLEHPPKSKLLNPSYLVRDLREAIELGLSTLDGWYSALGLSARVQRFVGATATLGVASAFAYSPVVASGLGALAIWQVALCCRHNRHGRALSLVAQSLYTPHMSALGFSAVATCSLAATARSLFQAMVPEDRPVARALIAALGFTATAGVFASSNDTYPLLSLENIPIISLGLGSVTGAFTDRFSWAARLTSLTGMGLSLMYHVSVTGSLTGVYANCLFILAGLWTIWRYDIAKQGEPTTPP